MQEKNKMSISHAMHGWSYANCAECQCFVLDTALFPVQSAGMCRVEQAQMQDAMEQITSSCCNSLMLALVSWWQHIPVMSTSPLWGVPSGAGISQLLFCCVCLHHISPDLLAFATRAAVISGSGNHECNFGSPPCNIPDYLLTAYGLQWLSFPQLWFSSIWTFESIPNPLSTSFDAAAPEQQQRSNQGFFKNL